METENSGTLDTSSSTTQVIFRTHTPQTTSGVGPIPKPSPKFGLTRAQKLEIIKELDAQPHLNFTKVSYKYNVNRKTISLVYKKRAELLRDVFKGNLDLNGKRKRSCKGSEVEEALFVWVKRELSNGSRIDTNELKAKAYELAGELSYQFQPNDSWISRFKSRRSLKFDKTFGYQLHITTPGPEYNINVDREPTETKTSKRQSRPKPKPKKRQPKQKLKIALQRKPIGASGSAAGGSRKHSHQRTGTKNKRVSPPFQRSFNNETISQNTAPMSTNNNINDLDLSIDEEDELSSSFYNNFNDKPSHRDLLDSLSVIQTFIRIHNLDPNEPFQDIEQKLLKISADSKRQRTIDYFFKPS